MIRVLVVISTLLLTAPVLAETLERIGGKIAHPWGISFIAEDEVVVTARGGRMYRINIGTGASAAITGLPKVEARQQGGLLDVLAESDADGIRLYFCYSRRVEGGAATTLMQAQLDGTALTGQE